MSQTPPPSITPLPPAPSTSSPSTFAALADAFLSALLTFATQIGLVAANVYNNAVDCYNNAVSALASKNAAAISETNAANTAAAITSSAAAITGAAAFVSGAMYNAGDPAYSTIDFKTYRRRTAGAGTTDPSQDGTNWASITGGGMKTYTGALDVAAYNVFMNYSGAVTLPDLTTVSSSFGLAALSNSLAVPATLTTSNGWSVSTGFVAGTLKEIVPAITPTPHGHWGNLSMTPPVLGTSSTVGAGTLKVIASVALSATCHVYAFSDTSGTYVIAVNPTTGLWGAPVTLAALQIDPGFLYAVSSTSFVFIGGTQVVAGSLTGLAIAKGTNLALTANMTRAPVQLSATTYLLRMALTSSDLVVVSVSGTTCTAGTAVSSGAAASAYTSVWLAPISSTAALVAYATTDATPATLTVRVASVSGTAITMNATAVSSTSAIAGANGNNGSLIPGSPGSAYMFAGVSSANSADGAWYGITVSGTAVTLGAVQTSSGLVANQHFSSTFVWRHNQGSGYSGWGQAIAANSSTVIAIVTGPKAMAVSISGTVLTFGTPFTTNSPYTLLMDMATGTNIYAVGSTGYSKLSLSGVTITAAYTVAVSPLAIFSDTLTDKAVSYSSTWYSWTGLPTMFFPIALDKYAGVSSNVLKSYGSFA